MSIRLGALFVTIAMAALGHAQSPPSWDLDPDPPSRTSFSLCHHEATGQTILFGGSNGVPLGDTWSWNGSWRRVPTGIAPPARRNYAVAYDSTRARIVLFGGRTDSALFGDTWAFDGTIWTQLTPLVSPPPQASPVMAYDPLRDRVVLRAGVLSLGGTTSTQLWEFDGANWALVPQGSLVPAFGGVIVHDPVRAETLYLTETAFHAWNGVSWEARSTAGFPGGSPLVGELVWDPVAQRVLLANPFLATTPSPNIWAWQGTSWALVGQSLHTTSLVHVAFDPARNVVVGVTDTVTSGGPSSTWLLDSLSWTRVQLGVPTGRARAAMAYDATRRRMVVHGGISQDFIQTTLFDTVELDGRDWVTGGVNSGGSLSRRDHAMVFDEARGVTVMLGGAQQLAPNVAEWNGSSWTFFNPAFAPPGRESCAMAYDSSRHRTLVFGGEGQQPSLGDLWAWSGTAWTSLGTSGPSPRRGARMSYDRDRDRVVLFGGTNGTTTFQDTWEYDGTSWTQIAVAAPPPARSFHVMAFDPYGHRTLMFGGTGVSALRDTWAWNGTAWTQIVTDVLPDAGENVCGAFDTDRRELVLFGGSVNHGEVWRLHDASLGTFESSGTGCATGFGDLGLTATAPLAIGSTTVLEAVHLPPSFLVLPIAWAGFSDQEWAGMPLPIPLSVFGSPDCDLRVEPAISFGMLNHGDGRASSPITLADDPVLVGTPVHFQVIAWDFVSGRFSASNAQSTRIGVP